MKATRATIPTLVAQRQAFTNGSKTMHAEKNPQSVSYRGLIDQERTRLRIDAEQNEIAYIVYSYGMPIAWETKNGWIYKVKQPLTQTSQSHMDLLSDMHEGHI